MQAAGDLIKATQQAQNPSVAIATYTQAANRGSFATQEIDEQILTYANAIGNIPSVPTDIRQAVFTFALTQMQKEVLATPADARTRLMYAGGLRSAGDIAGFNKEIDAALALSPKKQTLYIQKGIVAWQSGDKASAAKLFQQAYDLDTSFKAVATYAAAGRIITGDTEGGRALLIEKHGTTAVDDDILRFAFYEGKMFAELVESAKVRVQNAPQEAQSHLILVQSYMLAGRTAEARTELQATLAAFPEVAQAAAPLVKQLGL
jgi:tetratricopeptide (TPR) repeat protein